MIWTLLDEEKRGSRRKEGSGGRRDEEEGGMGRTCKLNSFWNYVQTRLKSADNLANSNNHIKKALIHYRKVQQKNSLLKLKKTKNWWPCEPSRAINYNLGNGYSVRNSFMVSKITKYARPWVLIFSINSLRLYYSSHPLIDKFYCTSLACARVQSINR